MSTTQSHRPPDAFGRPTGRVRLAPGVVGPKRIVVPNHGTPFGQSLRLDIRFDDRQRRYVLHALTLDRDEYGDAITGDQLRQIAVDMLVRVYVTVHVEEQPNPGKRDPWGRTVPAGVVTERNVTDRLLLWVAHLHKIGHAIEGKGTKYVEAGLDVPRPRAARWVGFARDRGFLEPTERK